MSLRLADIENLSFMFNRKKILFFLVHCLEANNVYQVLLKSEDKILSIVSRENWNPTKFFSDKSGRRLFEEIKRRTNLIEINEEVELEKVIISTPGNVSENKVILRSSRLGIYESMDIRNIFESKDREKYFIFHDTQCLALGEAKHGVLKTTDKEGVEIKNFAYIFLDEGIGCTLFIDGKPYLGNGTAGHIGRLVIEPMGNYNHAFASRGSLEVYASRPWVSQNMVFSYLSERNKNGALSDNESEFRRSLELIVEERSKWSTLPCEVFNKGLKENDPIAIRSIEEATQKLGMAINSIILVANPQTIILGGKMIWSVKSFAQKVIDYSRFFAYPNAWNKTEILISEMKMDSQALGALELYLQKK